MFEPSSTSTSTSTVGHVSAYPSYGLLYLAISWTGDDIC